MAGIEFLIAERFSLALYGRHDYCEKVGEGDTCFGLQANIKFSDTFGLTITPERSDEQDTGISVSGSFKH